MFLAHQRKTVNNPTEDFEIFVMNADGTKQKQLTNTANTGNTSGPPGSRPVVRSGLYTVFGTRLASSACVSPTTVSTGALWAVHDPG